MYADFRCVFTRERVGGFEKCHHCLVEEFFIINKVSMIGFIGLNPNDFQWLTMRLKQCGNDMESLGARDSYNGNCAHAMWRGEGANGVVIADMI